MIQYDSCGREGLTISLLVSVPDRMFIIGKPFPWYCVCCYKIDRVSTLQEDGEWPENEINYTRGCEAVRANWPAQEHWRRICKSWLYSYTPSDMITVVMAGAWNYALGHTSQPKDTRNLRFAISRAMDYWFNRDITNLACLDRGGTDRCPCTNTSDTTFWCVPLWL